MVKDKHEKAPPALAEGHENVPTHLPALPIPTAPPDKGGPFDKLLPNDSVPGTEYFLTLEKPNKLVKVSSDIPVGSPVIRVFHSNQHGTDTLLSRAGAPLKDEPQPTPDFRFKTPDPQAIEKSNEKYADNRRAHDHENAHREHAHK